MKHGVAIITGASSGLGRALALALAGEGFQVGLLARRAGELEVLAREIRDAGGHALAIPCDVADREKVHGAVAEVEEGLGPITLALANAGISDVTDPFALDAERVDRVMRVNFSGMVYLFEAVLPGMLERGDGHLVGVSSLAGIRGLPRASAYSASKAAMTAFLEGIRGELRGAGIAVTPILPGYVKTPMTAERSHPMPFLMEEEAAIRIMMRSIRRRERFLAFPWPLHLVLKVGRGFPSALWDRLAGKARGAPTPGEEIRTTSVRR